VEFGDWTELPVPEPARSSGSFTTRPCAALKVRAASTSLPTLFPSSTGSRLSPSSSHQEPSMTWLRPVDRTSGTLTLSAGTLSCLAHHGTPLSKRCPTTTALERTIVPMDDAERMPPLGAVKPRRKFFDVIHRAQCVAPVTGIHGLTARCHSGARWARVAVRDLVRAEDRNGSGASNWCHSQHFRFTPTSRRRSGHR
jgi:hypothetical protein